MSVLADSGHPKAQTLLDRLNSSAHDGESFVSAYTSVGLKAVDVLEMFNDVQQARTFIQALTSAGDVVQSLVRAAKDDFTVHEKCDGSGYQIDRRTGEQTDMECLPCRGTGYILKPGARDAQQLYFELINWKKQGGLVQIDARRQQANVQVVGGAGVVVGAVGSGAPDVVQLIKRADQILTPPVPGQGQGQGQGYGQPALPPTKEESDTAKIMDAELVGD